MGFVETLAQSLGHMFGHDPLSLGEVTLLFPNRRGVRALQECLMRVNDGRPHILPRMYALGDLAGDDSPFNLGDLGDLGAPTLPPPMPALERELLLTRLIMQGRVGLGRADLSPAEAARLARELTRLLDQLHGESKELSDLKDIVPEELASHWQRLLEFMTIIGESWDQIVESRGYIEPVKHRTALLKHIGEHLKSNPPAFPLIAAGSTGSQPQTAALLSIVSRLPHGAVVLPGFHRDMDQESWEQIITSPSAREHNPLSIAQSLGHPQAMMKQLLGRMRATREDVLDWPFISSKNNDLRATRLAMLQDALRPAATVPGWKEIAPKPDDSKRVFAGFSTITCTDPREEASTIALIMRHTLESKGKTAALVTANRVLARRVRAELTRWDIEVDDSAGEPLLKTPPAAFLTLVCQAAANHFEPISLLALLKHPFSANGMARDAFLRGLRQLEVSTLRGPAPTGGLNGLYRAINSKKAPKAKALCKHVKNTLAPLEVVFSQSRAPLKDMLHALISCCEDLARTPEQSGTEILWAGQNGETLATFLAELDEQSDLLPQINPLDLPGFLETLLAGKVSRKPFGTHPRLNIWGTLEARMQQADVMILGDLNEGSWPPQPQDDPWMSRPMRLALGLPTDEQRIGQSALDFVGGCAATEVIVTRSEKVDGTPTVPSRWLLRLQTFLGFLPGSTAPWKHYAQALDAPQTAAQPSPPPHPRPPVSLRPTKLSVTQIENWMVDPYAIYAKKILNLVPLDAPAADPGPAQRGQMIHTALETFSEEKSGDMGPEDLALLLEHGKRAFGDMINHASVWAFWWPRFEQIATAFISAQIKRQTHTKMIASEVDGETILDCGGVKFTLTGRADRLDKNQQTGALEIIDYKTGGAPSEKKIRGGYAPQLPLLGMLASKGCFKGLPALPVDSLSYWLVKGGKTPLEIKYPDVDATEEIEKAETGLRTLIATFHLEATPFLSNPRPAYTGYGDYDHLARVKEWVNDNPNGDTP